MSKPLLPRADFNALFLSSKIKITAIGDNRPFDNSDKAVEEAQKRPKYIDFEVIDTPINEQIGRTFRVKLSTISDLQVNDVLLIDNSHYQLTESVVTWYASQGQRYGHPWTYVNISIKGGEFVDRNKN